MIVYYIVFLILETILFLKIFIDYGENWEHAWNHHVETWNRTQTLKKDDDNSYTPVQDLIHNRDYRTVEEQISNPYPDNIQLLCFGGKLIESKGHLVNPKNGKSNDGNIVILNGPNGFEVEGPDQIQEPNFLFPCDILHADRNEEQYEVQIYFDDRSVKVKKYPEESIVMAPRGYSSDQHLEGAFRHFMEIEDDIFPSHWKEGLEKG